MQLGAVLDNLASAEWKQWVYLPKPGKLNAETPCIVVDPDTVELGQDGFTLLIVEHRGMVEFLSVQDLQMMREYIEKLGLKPSVERLTYASDVYFRRDAYPAAHELAELGNS